MKKRRALDFDAVTHLCASALLPPPPEHYRYDAMLLLCKQRQAETKLRRWAQARSRKPDFREKQANDDTLTTEEQI